MQVRDLLGSDEGAKLQEVILHDREVREVEGSESGV